MKDLLSLIVMINLCFSPVVAGEDLPERDQEKVGPAEYDGVVLGQLLQLARVRIPFAVPRSRTPLYPVPPILHVNKQGIAIASIGGGLLVAGMALIASSGADPVPFQTEDHRSAARLYGGGILAGIGGAMLWHGLCKLK